MLFLGLPLHCSFLSIPSNQSEHSHTLQAGNQGQSNECAYISLMYKINNSILSQNKTTCSKHTVNQTFLFATTLFGNLPEINLIAATNLYDQNVYYLENHLPETFYDWFVVRDIHDKKALANLTKISCTQIKVIYTSCIMSLPPGGESDFPFFSHQPTG